MATRVSVKINTNQLNRALKSVQQRVERVAVGAIEELMDEAVTNVTEKFQNAEYDGCTDDIEVYAEQLGPRTWRLVAEGEEVSFIEYGAGAKLNPAYINPTTGQPYWFFTAKGRNIRLGAGGSAVTVRKYKRRTADVQKYSYRAPRGTVTLNYELAKRQHRVVSRDGNEYYAEGGKLLYDPRTHQEKWLGANEYKISKYEDKRAVKLNKPMIVEGKPRKGVYISSGNPPNNIMRSASQEMTESIAKRFKAKFK